MVRVQLASTPSGAEVHNDGALLGRTPFEIDRPQRGGQALDLMLKLPGYKDLPVRVSPYTQEKLAVTLERKRTAAAAPRPAAPPAVKPPEPVKQEEPKRPRSRPSTEVLDPWN